MRNKVFVALIAVFIIAALSATTSFASGKEGFGTKVKNFWRNILGYPARVTEESASVVSDTTKRSADVISNSAKRLGEVTTGDVAKTKELVTEPITGTAETIVAAGEGTIKIPSEALKDNNLQEPAQTTPPLDK
jgi:Flp pilus assembly pilin Flp